MFVQYVNLFVYDTYLLSDVGCYGAYALCMLVCLLVAIYLPAIESNDNKCTEEGGGL
jgi:hypothetical protein